VMTHANAVVRLKDGKVLDRVSPAEAGMAMAAGTEAH
jgi:putative ABC transport system ATP-binding protein